MSDQRPEGQGNQNRGHPDGQQPPPPPTTTTNQNPPNEDRTILIIRTSVNFQMDVSTPAQQQNPGGPVPQDPQAPPPPAPTQQQQQQQQPQQSAGNPSDRITCAIGGRRSFERQVGGSNQFSGPSQNIVPSAVILPQRPLSVSVPSANQPAQQPLPPQQPPPAHQARRLRPRSSQLAIPGRRIYEPQLVYPTVAGALSDEFLQRIANSQGVHIEHAQPYFEMIRATFSNFLTQAVLRVGEELRPGNAPIANQPNGSCSVEETANRIMKRRREDEDDKDDENNGGNSRDNNPGLVPIR